MASIKCSHDYRYCEGFRHQIVRDLAWAIASPPLMILDDPGCRWYDDQWYQYQYSVSVPWLKALDRQPEQLQQRVDSLRDRRMGKYFETLWAFWLEQETRYEVIQQNLPLRGDGDTLGELDFLLLDKTTGKYLHWEMAVKFYLGVGDTRSQASWDGPGKKPGWINNPAFAAQAVTWQGAIEGSGVSCR